MSDEPTPIHLLLADVTDTAVDVWSPCPGPAQRASGFTAWFVRRGGGSPCDVYAVAYGASDSTTIELIPAEPGEDDAFAVMRGVFAGRPETARPDIECGVVHDGPVPDARPGPRMP